VIERARGTLAIERVRHRLKTDRLDNSMRDGSQQVVNLTAGEWDAWTGGACPKDRGQVSGFRCQGGLKTDFFGVSGMV